MARATDSMNCLGLIASLDEVLTEGPALLEDPVWYEGLGLEEAVWPWWMWIKNVQLTSWR